MTIFDGKLLFADGRNHLDVYLNLDCNLRCSHCFLGDELNRRQNFERNSVISLMRYARASGCTEMSFLGGEPTLYDGLGTLVEMAFEVGFEEVKVITNGLKPARAFLRGYQCAKKPTMVFSCDGAELATFEKIRGKNTFQVFSETVLLARELAYPCAGIVSVSNDNIGEIGAIVEQLDAHGFLYVNVHHVNSLGFAQKASITSVADWLTLRKALMDLSIQLRIKIKFERKFSERNADELKTNCVINEQKNGNIMVFPDGRVYRCALFFNSKGLNSLYWDGDQMIQVNQLNEQLICSLTDECNGCAGSAFFGLDEPKSEDGTVYKTVCMYKKEVL